MIAIINLGPTNEHEGLDPGGERNYVVKINQDEIIRFVHNRRDGLATCLELAGRAVRSYEEKQRSKA